MCDEFTESAEDQALGRKGLTRREFAAISAAAALAACAKPSNASGRDAALKEAMVDVTTADGRADAFFVHPTSGSYPGVIIWPDIAGLREVKKQMARRLASSGYAVLLVNQYYRSAKAPVMTDFAEFRTPEGRAKVMGMVPLLTEDAVARDGASFATWLDAQPAVDKQRGIGTQGYCMGGPFTIRTAAAANQRVKAAASFHGGGLVTDSPDSPHRLLGATQASYLIAVARNDDEKTPGAKEAFRTAATAAGRPAEIEVYPADLGWCVPDSPAYDQAQADRAWDRLLALYAKL